MKMRISELIKVIDTMEVPEARKKLTMANTRWLLRNLRIHNGGHSHIDETMATLKVLARESAEVKSEKEKGEL